jgi:hypothetical protein
LPLILRVLMVAELSCLKVEILEAFARALSFRVR